MTVIIGPASQTKTLLQFVSQILATRSFVVMLVLVSRNEAQISHAICCRRGAVPIGTAAGPDVSSTVLIMHHLDGLSSKPS